MLNLEGKKRHNVAKGVDCGRENENGPGTEYIKIDQEISRD